MQIAPIKLQRIDVGQLALYAKCGYFEVPSHCCGGSLRAMGEWLDAIKIIGFRESDPRGRVLAVNSQHRMQVENVLFQPGWYTVPLLRPHCSFQIKNIFFNPGSCLEPFLIVIHGASLPTSELLT
jgi:hypothetical protein